MRRVALVLVSALLFSGCSASSQEAADEHGGDEAIAAQAGTVAPMTLAEKNLRDWISQWSDEVKLGLYPNEFWVPAPPRISLTQGDEQIRTDVHRAAREIHGGTGWTSVLHMRHVFCSWFGWYVLTGESVPEAKALGKLVLHKGFNLYFRKGRSNPDFLHGAELFRAAIVRGQGLDEADRRYATAAACTIQR